MKSLFISSLFVLVHGDPNDWVSVRYLVANGQYAGRVAGSLSEARATIIRYADKQDGLGIVNTKDVLPPSNDFHDYLSWAPYHWPDCNWCPAGKTHLVHTIDGSNNDTTNAQVSQSSTISSYPSYSPDDPYQYFARRPDRSRSYQKRQVDTPNLPSTQLGVLPTSISTLPLISISSSFLSNPAVPVATTPAESPTRGPAQAAAKTSKSTCTPSPTKPIAPSATWTTCRYVVRDGQVNPDVRTLRGAGAINSVSEAVWLNAAAYIFQKQPTYSRNVVNFIDTFFLKDTTKMNPNVKFGQIVRGPGEEGSEGTFTGILDLRGMVKIANAIGVMKAARSPDWSSDVASAMTSWSGKYDDWLVNSDIGRMAASRPNNHVTFYVSQVAAIAMLRDDNTSAINALQHFFATHFLDQLAASGEQPFEAIRTRPFHYRAFNLEALITIAKMGDELGMNFWTTKSKYGATIQTALDFLMHQDPKGEDISQIFPHVAAIGAAYGDTTGKYAAFLKNHDANYQSKTYWFYDQPEAFLNAPHSRSKRSVMWTRDDAPAPPLPSESTAPVPGSIPFECPAVFDDVVEVEIDDGIYVTCDQLRLFYLDNQTTNTPPVGA